jgi:hypothetical protein
LEEVEEDSQIRKREEWPGVQKYSLLHKEELVEVKGKRHQNERTQ